MHYSMFVKTNAINLGIIKINDIHFGITFQSLKEESINLVKIQIVLEKHSFINTLVFVNNYVYGLDNF